MKKVLAAVAVAMTLPMTVMAWEPTGDVNVIVAYKAGSGTDTGARLLATEAQKYIPKTIIIQNLPGADGKIGWTKLVQTRRPDYRLHQPADIHNFGCTVGGTLLHQ